MKRKRDAAIARAAAAYGLNHGEPRRSRAAPRHSRPAKVSATEDIGKAHEGRPDRFFAARYSGPKYGANKVSSNQGASSVFDKPLKEDFDLVKPAELWENIGPRTARGRENANNSIQAVSRML